MKKKYTMPQTNLIALEFSYAVTANSGNTKGGHGYGDKNHDHEHWKDNKEPGERVGNNAWNKWEPLWE